MNGGIKVGDLVRKQRFSVAPPITSAKRSGGNVLFPDRPSAQLVSLGANLKFSLRDNINFEILKTYPIFNKRKNIKPI